MLNAIPGPAKAGVPTRLRIDIPIAMARIIGLNVAIPGTP
jgi:hypothetical protein